MTLPTGIFDSSDRGRIADGYPVRVVLGPSRPFENPAAAQAALARIDEDASAESFADRMGIDPDAAVTATAPVGASANRSAPVTRPGLVNIDFDIAQYGRSALPDPSRAVQDSKALVVGGQKVGTIALIVGEGATVSVDRQALLALVGAHDPALAASLARVQGDQVTFEALRSRDVGIRYDPLADAVIIESKS